MAPQLERTGVVPAWTLSDRLRKARETAPREGELGQMGLTQQELADAIDEPRRAIVDYENGTRVPKRPVLIAWSLRCAVDYTWLLGSDDVDPTSADSAEITGNIYFHGNESSHTGEADQAIDAQRVLVMAS